MKTVTCIIWESRSFQTKAWFHTPSHNVMELKTGSMIYICTMKSLIGKFGEVNGEVFLYELLG